jgi:predicted ferric reductase
MKDKVKVALILTGLFLVVAAGLYFSYRNFRECREHFSLIYCLTRKN